MALQATYIFTFLPVFFLKPRRSQNSPKMTTAQVWWQMVTNISKTLTKQRSLSCEGSFCRVFPNCSSLQHCLAWPCRWQGQTLGHYWKEELCIGWIETKVLSVFFKQQGSPGRRRESEGENISSSVAPHVRAGPEYPVERDWLLRSYTSAFWVKSPSDITCCLKASQLCICNLCCPPRLDHSPPSLFSFFKGTGSEKNRGSNNKENKLKISPFITLPFLCPKVIF